MKTALTLVALTFAPVVAPASDPDRPVLMTQKPDVVIETVRARLKNIYVGMAPGAVWRELSGVSLDVVEFDDIGHVAVSHRVRGTLMLDIEFRFAPGNRLELVKVTLRKGSQIIAKVGK